MARYRKFPKGMNHPVVGGDKRKRKEKFVG